MHLSHVHSPLAPAAGAFMPAAPQSKLLFSDDGGAGAGEATGFVRSKVGREVLGTAFTSSCAFPGADGSGKVKVKEGRDMSGWCFALSFALSGVGEGGRVAAGGGAKAEWALGAGVTSFFCVSTAGRAGAVGGRVEGVREKGFGADSSSTLGSGAGEEGAEVDSGCMLNRNLLGSLGRLDFGPNSVFVEGEGWGGTAMTGTLIGAGLSFFAAD